MKECLVCVIQGSTVRGGEWRNEVKRLQTEVSDRETLPGELELQNEGFSSSQLCILGH